MSSKHWYFRIAPVSLLVSLAVFVCGTVSGCGLGPFESGQRSRPANVNAGVQSSAQVIAQLQRARTLDEEYARDLTISLLRSEDFLNHGTQAGLAINDLQHGYPVSEERLSYAFEVPPKHITPEKRVALIEDLTQAIRKDESREQAVVSFGTDIFFEDPNAPSEFGAQEKLAQHEIKNLEEGNHVSWDEVQQAMYVPFDPL